MSIDPEVIPEASNDGVDATKLSNSWYAYIIALVATFTAVFVLKALIEAALITLGLIFIWSLATR